MPILYQQALMSKIALHKQVLRTRNEAMRDHHWISVEVLHPLSLHPKHMPKFRQANTSSSLKFQYTDKDYSVSASC